MFNPFLDITVDERQLIKPGLEFFFFPSQLADVLLVCIPYGS